MQTQTMKAMSHAVPADIIMDALGILFENDIAFDVEGIDEEDTTILIRTSTNPKLRRHRDVLDNLKEMIKDFKYYREETHISN